MNLSRQCLHPALAGLLATAAPAANTLHFEITAPSTTVALQFDVISSLPSSTLATPVFEGTSPHTAESHSAVPGRTRHVVYSTTGLGISQKGRVRVTFTSAQPISSGSLQITAVKASDKDGILIPSANVNVNTLPVLAGPIQPHRSAEIGSPVRLAATLVDPDGTVVQADHRMNGTSLGNSSFAPPFAISWSPTIAGTFAHSVRATDNFGGLGDLSLGSVRAYGNAELTDFASFGQIHFGSEAHPTSYLFDEDPLAIGIENGIAHLLGINPHSPDRSRLPNATVETIEGQRHLVMRFTRRTAAPAAGWTVWESGTLADGTWSQVGVQTISQADLGNGLTQVTIRRPLGATPPGKLFLQLEATP